MAEATIAPIRIVEFIDDIECHLLNGHKHHLGDTLTRFDLVGISPSIPDGYEYLALVVRIDEPGQVTEYKTMLVTQPGSRQQNRSEASVTNVDGQSGWNQDSVSGCHGHRLVNTRAHVEARGPVRCIMW